MTQTAMYSFARRMRLSRLFHTQSSRLLVVPLDHSVAEGPLRTKGTIKELVASLARGGVDAVILHRGSVRYVCAQAFKETSLIIHLSASTKHAPDPDSKYLVADVEEAIRLGADAVSVHVNLGSDNEVQQIRDFAAVAAECDRWNLPLLSMVYPRGPRTTDPRDPSLVAHAVSLAVDIGADIVKTVYTGSPESMAEIISGSPIPVLVAGGSRVADPAELGEFVEEILGSGAAGLAMGRNIFESHNPEATARCIADVVHSRHPRSVLNSVFTRANHPQFM
ncbi:MULTISPECIES: 2-amino-3,7-dideoxy-D-threo-hept-6-ulosonate synthase [unclassified Nocardia]|uniref:2-amino-3,7-dideoxy-D-threo-hept-6-ulosonate synthase n=1 Tax=unclassified Nocardia TaxID=2637762 RepID=UPI001CE3E923|nr:MULTISPECIES: 2-amino-3,7-dideoxy-D-threo-hept-6-ulosonate synthase [unclassified Nocardia]